MYKEHKNLSVATVHLDIYLIFYSSTSFNLLFKKLAPKQIFIEYSFVDRMAANTKCSEFMPFHKRYYCWHSCFPRHQPS